MCATRRGSPATRRMRGLPPFAQADAVERFVVVHGQILLNQFQHFPKKAVARAAFVGALKERMAQRRHHVLYSTPRPAARVRGLRANPMRDRASARAKPMTATATAMVRTVWQSYFKTDAPADGAPRPLPVCPPLGRRPIRLLNALLWSDQARQACHIAPAAAPRGALRLAGCARPGMPHFSPGHFMVGWLPSCMTHRGLGGSGPSQWFACGGAATHARPPARPPRCAGRRPTDARARATAGEEAAAAATAAGAPVATEVDEDVNAEDDEAGEETALAAAPAAPVRRAARKAPKAPKAAWVGEPLADGGGCKTYRCVPPAPLFAQPLGLWWLLCNQPWAFQWARAGLCGVGHARSSGVLSRGVAWCLCGASG